MDFFKNLDQNVVRILKVAGIALLILIIMSVLLGSLNRARNTDGGSYAPMAQNVFMGMKESAGMPTLSVRNTEDSYIPPVPGGGYASGDESESFEVKEYSARIETRDLDRDCGVIRALKSRDDVIFERASEYERGCSYVFKVRKGSVEEILTTLKNLNPRNLSENAYTIKREVDDYTSEIEILKNKLASLDVTLAEALASYENITALATRVGDVESLAKIIESKLTIIERLTEARIGTSNELERMNRAKAEALDRLEYTYFSVEVYENVYADTTVIRDSWKAAVQEFVRTTNILVQDMSVGLIGLMLLIVKFALYLLVLLVAIKFGWAFVQKLWRA